VRVDKNKDGDCTQLSADEAQKFHREIFTRNGLPEKSWTLEIPFNMLNKEKRDELWKEILDSAGNSKDEIIVSMKTVKDMTFSQNANFHLLKAYSNPFFGDPEKERRAYKNFSDISEWLGINISVENTKEVTEAIIGQDNIEALRDTLTNSYDTMHRRFNKALKDAQRYFDGKTPKQDIRGDASPETESQKSAPVPAAESTLNTPPPLLTPEQYEALPVEQRRQTLATALRYDPQWAFQAYPALDRVRDAFQAVVVKSEGMDPQRRDSMLHLLKELLADQLERGRVFSPQKAVMWVNNVIDGQEMSRDRDRGWDLGY